MSAHYGSYDHREPVERLIDATPERFDLAALLASLRPAWMNEAPCYAKGVDFFPGVGDRAVAAKAMCATCPVQQTCLDYALAEGIGHGIWGGMNETDRAKLRRAPIDHGTSAGYYAHRRYRELPCEDCRLAHNRACVERDAARRMAVSA